MSASLPSPEPEKPTHLNDFTEAECLPESEESDAATEALDAEDAAAGRRPHWRAWVYGIVVMMIVFFGAGREPWARGLALLLMGGAMVIAPPRMKLRPLPSLMLVILALVPGVGLLPASWFGGIEQWRNTLGQEWGISMPSTLSPEWRLTLEAWLVTLVGVAWFWCCLAQNFSDGGRRLLLRLLCLAVLPLAVLTLMDKAGWVDVSWWPRGHADAATRDAPGFGPFANQNHTSSLFAWMSVLCAAAMVDAFKRGSRLWIVFGAGVLLLLRCIMVNSSRAGLLLFFIGMTLWLATTAMRRGVMRKLVVTLAIIVAVVSIAIASGSRLGERLTEKSLNASLSSDLRLWLAGHVVRASADAPWSGRGLGIFDHVFPQVCDGFYPDTRTMHPESDLLWALFEGGLFLVLPCLILTGWLFQTSGPWMSSGRKRKHSQDSRSGRRVRRAFGIAAGLALLHGVFDVPLHNFGYFVVFSLVTAQAVRGRYLTARIQPALSLAFRGAGLAVALWGALWMAFAFGWTEVSTASGATLFHDRAVAEAARGQRAEAMRLINRAIELTPLQYRWYFLRAQLHLVMRHGSAVALEDFGRVRALEPRYGPVCFEEGRYWLFFDPPMALIPWQEGMRRYPREFANAMPRFQEMVLEAAPFPEIRQQLWKVADRPSLQLVFLAHVSGGEFWLKCQKEVMAQYPGLVGMNEPQKRFFFRLWQVKGVLKEMVAYLQDHPSLQPFGWQAVARDLAASGKFEEAYKLAARFLPTQARSATLMASDIPRLERALVLNPIDPLPGVELYYAQRAGGDLKSARKTLERVMGLPNSPDFLPREMASVLAASGDMRGAWEMMQGLFDKEGVEVSVLDDAPPEAISGEGFALPVAPPAPKAGTAVRDAYEGLDR
ncbi:MAG: O-antigen ligase family protein [Verrucomicrobiota bacterium]